MKIGDIVRQKDDGILKMTKNGKPIASSTMLGVVVGIHNQLQSQREEARHLRSWMKILGRGIDVLWACGKLSENFSENSLEVVTVGK